MQSIIQIVKVGEILDKTWEGRAYKQQEAECLLLDDAGQIDQVGVLRVPTELHGQVKTGVYIGSFAFRASPKNRRLEAVLTGLQPYVAKRADKASAAA